MNLHILSMFEGTFSLDVWPIYCPYAECKAERVVSPKFYIFPLSRFLCTAEIYQLCYFGGKDTSQFLGIWFMPCMNGGGVCSAIRLLSTFNYIMTVSECNSGLNTRPTTILHHRHDMENHLFFL